MASVEYRNVSKIYPNGIMAVDGFNLTVASGEIVVLLGPSGCGKTSTLRMAAGLEEITLGELYIDGVLANDIKPSERGVAMVFQNYALFPYMNVYENIAFGLKPHNLSSEIVQDKVSAIADTMQVSHILERMPNQISGGQRQRVALARGFIRESKVVLLDEPFSNLDYKLRTEMRAELKILHKKFGMTAIYVTHDQSDALAVADRIVLMHNGVTQQIGTPRELFESPANQNVSNFLGLDKVQFVNMMGEDGSEIKVGVHSKDFIRF